MGLGADRWARLCLLGMLCAGTGAAVSQGAVNNRVSASGVGLNLGSWDSYTPDEPMIDQFKRAKAWLTQCQPWADPSCKGFENGAGNFDTREQGKLDLDEQGWVRSLPSTNDATVKYRMVSALLFDGDGDARPAGRYVVLYDGKGTLEYSLAGKRVAGESRPGRDVVEVSADAKASLLISLRATDPKNHLRNIRVLPPGGVCEQAADTVVPGPAACRDGGRGSFVPFEKLLASQRWHPRYLKDLTGFRALRFLDWTRTNDSKLVSWNDRPRMESAVWSGEHGVPVEAMVDLANASRTDPWINLPTRADDDYARQFARTVKSQLARPRTLYLEYGNEPWNYAFSNSHWIKDQVATRWPGGRAPAGQDAYTLAANWYAWRAAHLCGIVKAEFGADAARVRCVANAQAANPWNADQVLACPLAAPVLGKPCNKIFDGLAVAPYFGGYLADAKAHELGSSWLREPDGGLTRLFDEILAQRDGKAVPPPLQGRVTEGAAKGALSQAAAWIVGAKAVADRHGLPLLAYEGGQHLTLPPGPLDDNWLKLLIAANRDPRMGQAYARHLADWRSAGGQLFMFYSHVSRPGPYGFWGLKSSQAADADPKWRAALAYRDDTPCWWRGCMPAGTAP